jgi:release factor glutamine methyltransferase
LVELALARIPQDFNAEIADLGTGSGAIALAIARERPRCRLIASDISAGALAVAEANTKRLGLSNVTYLLGDWFSPLQARHFDIIVSNPPYIAHCDPHLKQDGVCFEPRTALISDAQGLGDIQRIARLAAAHLKPGGWLIVEHGYEQGSQVRRLFKLHGFEHVETNRDGAGHERATTGCSTSSPPLITAGQNAGFKRLPVRRT